MTDPTPQESDAGKATPAAIRLQSGVVPPDTAAHCGPKPPNARLPKTATTAADPDAERARTRTWNVDRNPKHIGRAAGTEHARLSEERRGLMATEPNRCTAKRKDGGDCQAPALEDGYCFAHSPSRKAERDEARRRGGKNSAKVIRLRGLVPPRLTGIYDKLEAAFDEVHDGATFSPRHGASPRVLGPGDGERVDGWRARGTSTRPRSAVRATERSNPDDGKPSAAPRGNLTGCKTPKSTDKSRTTADVFLSTTHERGRLLAELDQLIEAVRAPVPPGWQPGAAPGPRTLGGGAG